VRRDPQFSAPGSAIGLGWRLSRWGNRTIVGHDGDTIGQSAYLRIDPEAGIAACLLTNSAESEFDVSVRDGQLRMALTMTGNLAALVDAEPEDLPLYPAEATDSSGTRFLVRSGDDEPWAPVSFDQLADGTPYLYMSGRVARRVG
jgi:hypothetical protein